MIPFVLAVLVGSVLVGSACPPQLPDQEAAPTVSLLSPVPFQVVQREEYDPRAAHEPQNHTPVRNRSVPDTSISSRRVSN